MQHLLLTKSFFARLTYDEYSENLHSYFGNENAVLWTFDPGIVFTRVHNFIDRLNVIQVGVHPAIERAILEEHYIYKS